MITVRVTGKDGQLAQCIKSIAPEYPDLNFVFKSSSELDITNYNHIDSVFKSSEPFDYCINCAAYTAVDKAEAETQRAYDVNVLGSKNIAEACRNYNITLIHISTDFVFDGDTSQPYTEASATNPLGVYGDTKLKGEQAIAKELTKYFIIRTSWLYSEYGNNFLKTMLRLASERDEISVVSDQIGSPTYAKDLAEAILKLIEIKNKSYGLYHYSNEGSISWYGFAKEIFRITNNDIRLNTIETKDYPTPATRPKYSILNTSKIRNTLNIHIPNWKDGLTRALSHLTE
jgi:dTDP-4-dehydrorhamnose reductase